MSSLEKRLVWEPQPRQEEFMKRWEYEALYGGAAGGGKSDTLLMEALRQVHIPHYRGLILRKTFPQLSELIDRSRELYPLSHPKAKYNATEHTWRFPAGAKIQFGSMQHPGDKVHYQGKRFDYIAVDELTHFTLEEYMYLYSRNRPGGPGTRVYIRAATNPGGIGHGWVKERFISPAPPMTTIYTTVEYRDENGQKVTAKRSRIFVPAKVYDNKILLRNDPSYIENMAMMPKADKEALLEGSWDSFTGQVFRLVDDPAHYYDRMATHIIDPFDIPAHWRIYRGYDDGSAAPFAVGWFAVDEKRRIYHIREFYGWNGTPNCGCFMDPKQIARKIYEIEHDDPMLKGKPIIGIADTSIFDKDHGQSVAEMMETERVYFSKSDKHRIPGKRQLQWRLRFDDYAEDGVTPTGRPMFYVFKTCVNFIRTIPLLIYDEKDVEDVDTRGEDHIYDMTRYVLMENPITAPPPRELRPYRPDPLGVYTR